MKKARVKTIKNNIQKGVSVPASGKDSDVGIWIDAEMSKKGHRIDKNGIVDLPEYGIDNKSRKQGSRCHHTVGSMTINDILNTPTWYDTRYYKKSLNQNQITWHEDFLEVTNVSVVDMDLPEIQELLKRAYESLRDKIVSGDRRKNITSNCGWAVFDGYNHPNSYRYRITDSAMKKIQNMSRSRDTRKNLFEEVL